MILLGPWFYRRWSVRLLWEPRDLWIGVFWEKSPVGLVDRSVKVYLCLVPCLPVLVTYDIRLPMWRR